MNAYIPFCLINQMKKVLSLRNGEEEQTWRRQRMSIPRTEDDVQDHQQAVEDVSA